MAKQSFFLLILATASSASSLLDEAYLAMRDGQHADAVRLFSQGLEITPTHQAARKDYAYLLMRLGNSRQAREQFRIITENDPEDAHALLEYAFLCHETGERRQARLIFDQIRYTSNDIHQQTADRAFLNIDQALETAIHRWQEALTKQPQADSIHEELARLLEERNEPLQAEKHYEEAFRLRPSKERFLLDIGRVRRWIGNHRESLVAYVAATHSNDIRTAEQAQEAIAGHEIGEDIQIAARSYRPTPVITPRPERSSETTALLMADRSFDRSFLPDALRYYESAYESDPQNSYIQLRLGLTHNLLGKDDAAYQWLSKARQSSDPLVAAEANRAWNNLRPAHTPYRLTVWALPMYSSRWQSGFAYGQAKMELNKQWFFRPYLSLRAATDGGSSRAPGPLSERAWTPAIGITSRPWHRIVFWAEGGGNIGNTQGPDARSGVIHTHGWGSQLNAESPGLYYLMENGLNYASRFSHNVLFSSQNRAGYTFGRWQLGGFFAVATDSLREYWGNYVEAGPSLRMRLPRLPANAFLNVEFVHGINYISRGNPRPAHYFDLRIGLWYAFTY